VTLAGSYDSATAQTAARRVGAVRRWRREDTAGGMPAPSERIEPTQEWHQLEFRVRADGRRSDELIRPVVLFGHSPAERAVQTGAAERTLYRQVARFAQLGMASFVPPPKAEKHRTLPPRVRQAILDLKREHPPLNVNESRTICWARFAHRPSSATVRRVLAEAPPPPRAHRRFAPFHALADPTERRLAIVRLHIEGRNEQSSARLCWPFTPSGAGYWHFCARTTRRSLRVE